MEHVTPTESGLFNRQQNFWENYRKGRPVIPPSFFQRFYDYHASHGGSFGTIHDVGAGFGQFSVELGKKFAKVVVSDPAEQSLQVAREACLTADKDNESKFTFFQAGAEDSVVPDSSVDAVFICNAIHWTDPERAVAAFSRQLKPGGTLFIGFNSVPKYDPKIQPAWWDMIDSFMEEGLSRRMKKGDLLRVLAMQDDGYDCVPIPESQYERGVLRVKLNMMGDRRAFVQAPRMTRETTLESMVGLHDKVVEETDKDWFFESGLSDLKATVGSYPLDPDPELLERHMKKLGALLDGRKCDGHWPVSMIFATRKF